MKKVFDFNNYRGSYQNELAPNQILFLYFYFVMMHMITSMIEELGFMVILMQLRFVIPLILFYLIMVCKKYMNHDYSRHSAEM